MDKVTVIVVNWNGRKFLANCLQGLREQRYPHFSTRLVDNGSVDGSVDFVRQHFPEVRTVALPTNMGFAAGNNVALATVTTEFVALINNDAVAQPTWLENLVAGLERNPRAGFAASKMVYFENPDQIDRAGDAYTLAGAGSLRGRGTATERFNRPEWIFGASAGAALYRMRMLADIGFFDEDFFLIYEDVDLSFRAQLRGYRCLYVPEAVVHHMATKSIGYDSATSVYFGHRNLEWTYIQNMPNTLILQTIGFHLLYVVGAFLFFLIRGQGGTYLKAKKDALKGLRRSLAKRKQVQAGRNVPDGYIWQLLDPDFFFLRFTRRLRRK